MSSFLRLILLIASWILTCVGEDASEAASERFITANDSTFPDFSEELEQFSVAGDLLYNLASL